ncbi:hypothetical protein M9H77_18550 [Catharanthus roseus]|uniref:Uncharacterized protein n=1 Tax=Catharanthus roseus TaxID=4058 RepID=A0ACC0B7U2_CATRO|nr:hypothetical protein M9H77_18550 [Catharanthus roseus]
MKKCSFYGLFRPTYRRKKFIFLLNSSLSNNKNIPITYNMNTTTLPKHITTVTQMVSDEPSMLYSAVNNDDKEVDGSDGDEAISSQSKSDDDNESEEGEFQAPINPVNPVNPVTENTVQ